MNRFNKNVRPIDFFGADDFFCKTANFFSIYY